eukprot:1151810-Pelagomonas_calceolata.AAC.11
MTLLSWGLSSLTQDPTFGCVYTTVYPTAAFAGGKGKGHIAVPACFLLEHWQTPWRSMLAAPVYQTHVLPCFYLLPPAWLPYTVVIHGAWRQKRKKRTVYASQGLRAFRIGLVRVTKLFLPMRVAWLKHQGCVRHLHLQVEGLHDLDDKMSLCSTA